ncbi:unnamed protein product [Cylicocyclus nassatus]|uniref:Uncharacterized protein n=1 Tax=Cylicocyclus nassatus TaxID=53992 RepID=A0AA36GVP8_CYLNA|nr:unnamed protein product [Cylicocyclus nassatus]
MKTRNSTITVSYGSDLDLLFPGANHWMRTVSRKKNILNVNETFTFCERDPYHFRMPECEGFANVNGTIVTRAEMNFDGIRLTNVLRRDAGTYRPGKKHKNGTVDFYDLVFKVVVTGNKTEIEARRKEFETNRTQLLEKREKRRQLRKERQQLGKPNTMQSS